MFIIHVQITILKPLYIVTWTWIVNIYVLYKDILYMGIYIVKKNIFFYCNGVGGALRGTRQGPVLEYLWVFQHF